MNIRALLLVLGVPLLLADCEQSAEVSIPMFPDGGLLRAGTPLAREQLYDFEGMFSVTKGSSLLGEHSSIITSRGTISILTDKSAGFAVTGAACLTDRRVVVEGYWQYPTEVEAGLVRLFVEPLEVAEAFCNGETPDPTTAFTLTGSYGHGVDFPTIPLSLSWDHELKPWRGRFFTVAHHGACEITDHCGTTPNSLESIRLSERVGSNAAEVDVRVTRDGIPVLFHDPGLSSSLVRGLFCNGQLADMSLAELRGSCLLRYGEDIPTLEEALRMMVDDTELEGVYLDQKTADGVLPSSRIASRIIGELRARNENADPSDDRTFSPLIAITTEEVLAAWHETKDVLTAEGIEIPPCLLEYDPDLVLSEGCVAWGPTWTLGPRADDVRRVREGGAGTIFWTINHSDFIDAFLKEAQPDGIISARASMLFHRYQLLGTPPPPRGVQP